MELELMEAKLARPFPINQMMNIQTPVFSPLCYDCPHEDSWRGLSCEGLPLLDVPVPLPLIPQDQASRSSGLTRFRPLPRIKLIPLRRRTHGREIGGLSHIFPLHGYASRDVCVHLRDSYHSGIPFYHFHLYFPEELAHRMFEGYHLILHMQPFED